LRTADGTPIRLGDVATDSRHGAKSSGLWRSLHGKPAVAIDITKQNKAKRRGRRRRRQKAIKTMELPADTSIQVVRDTSTFIRESVADVQNSLVLGGLLTIIIVFLFLNSWRSTVITA
jgi:HAE1 family hydrophobic/amphiphilic exporter-1